MRYLILIVILVAGCATKKTPEPEAETTEAVAVGDCSQAKNVCPDYAPYWVDACPDGARCLSFTNSCAHDVAIGYQIGCNGDGSKGAPQCDCTAGPTLKPSDVAHWRIVDGNYASCLPSWQPPCLTDGLAIMANAGDEATCSQGTRFEFSAGNTADVYGHFDSYNLDTEHGWFAVAISVKPDLECANDHAAHDCRPLWCGSVDCPDAYDTPTSGGCVDGRSPQVGCQDTFGKGVGLTIEFCPAACKADDCPSCQDAKGC